MMVRPNAPLPLPEDTAAAYARYGADCHNLGLLLDHYQPWQWLDRQRNAWKLGVWVRERRRRQFEERWATGNEAKGLWLRDERLRDGTRYEQLDPPLAPSRRIDTTALVAYCQRWRAAVMQMGGDPFDFKTQSRLVVGLGADTVLETALTLHQVYGFAIIPGSALKGLARTHALVNLAEKLGVFVLTPEAYRERKQSEQAQRTPMEYLEIILDSEPTAWPEPLRYLQRDPALQNGAPIAALDAEGLADAPDVQAFRDVFGFLGQAGRVVFFDAVPTEPPTFAVDVMNVHYPDYYRDSEGHTPPSDDQNPQPVSFLTVDKGNTFTFAVGPRRPSVGDDQRAAEQARSWLQVALHEMGAGAKTVAGYGIFGTHAPVEFGPAAREAEWPAPSPRPKPAVAPEPAPGAGVRPEKPTPAPRGLEGLEKDMILEGTVDSIATSGALVDVGVGFNGLVHISELKEGWVDRVEDVVQVGQSVRVRVLEVDVDRQRISLSMKGIPQPE